MSEQLEQWRSQFAESAGIDQATDNAPAEQEADTADTTAADVGQPRNELGQYASKDTVTEPEPATTEQTDTGEAPPVEEGEPSQEDTDAAEYAKYLEKYGNDPEKLSRAGFEASKLIGRQSAEVHEARQIQAQVEEMKAMLEAQQAATQQPSYTADDVQQFLDENPGMAPQLAQRAKEIGDDGLYNRAMATWAEIDAVGAMDYAGRIAAWEANNQMRVELAPLFSAAQTQQQAATATAAVEQVAAKHNDFAEVIDTVTQDVLDSLHPAILASLRDGDTASKAAALDTLYYAARGVQAERQPQAQAAATAAAQQSARQQRTDATVASANQANPQPRETSSNVETWREQFRESPAFRKAAGLT